MPVRLLRRAVRGASVGRAAVRGLLRLPVLRPGVVGWRLPVRRRLRRSPVWRLLTPVGWWLLASVLRLLVPVRRLLSPIWGRLAPVRIRLARLVLVRHACLLQGGKHTCWQVAAATHGPGAVHAAASTNP